MSYLFKETVIQDRNAKLRNPQQGMMAKVKVFCYDLITVILTFNSLVVSPLQLFTTHIFPKLFFNISYSVTYHNG